MARAARRISRLFMGSLLMVLGAAMLVLPGPGIVTIGLGLGVIGRELRWGWVLRAEARIRERAQRLGERVPSFVPFRARIG